MKVVDMFGCHLPVLAKKFEAINELVVDGTTGKLFDNSQELKQDLIELAAGFPKNSHVISFKFMKKLAREYKVVIYIGSLNNFLI